MRDAYVAHGTFLRLHSLYISVIPLLIGSNYDPSYIVELALLFFT